MPSWLSGSPSQTRIFWLSAMEAGTPGLYGSQIRCGLALAVMLPGHCKDAREAETSAIVSHITLRMSMVCWLVYKKVAQQPGALSGKLERLAPSLGSLQSVLCRCRSYTTELKTASDACTRCYQHTCSFAGVLDRI